MIPVNTPVLGDREKELVINCLDTGWISSEGAYVNEFEEKFSSYIGKKFGIAVSSGSAALDVVFDSLGLLEGDEVIMPTFSIISPAFSIFRTGAVPVLVDCDKETWNMDVKQVADKINSKTKAICIVHTYGLPVNVNPIKKLAKEHGLWLIEDAAEMLGQEYYNEKCGSLGDVSIFSFYPNKLVTTGEGGMILCDDELLAEKFREKKNLSFKKAGRRFIHEDIGWNYRMTNIQAALGIAQLERIDKVIKRKKEIGIMYYNLLKENDQIKLPLIKTDYSENIFWVFGIQSKSELLAKNLVEYLTNENIGTRPFFWCMHEQPFFLNKGFFPFDSHPVAEEMARCGFYIPSGLGITNNEIELVAETINRKLRS